MMGRAAILGIFFVVCVCLLGCRETTVESDRGMHVELMAPGTYDSFVKNWDSDAVPVLCAFIESEAEWKTVFQPAATMKEDQKFGPDASFFDEKSILVVARVTNIDFEDRGNASSTYLIKEVDADGGKLTVSFEYDRQGKAGSSEVKDFAGFIVPKADYKTVHVIENGEALADLDLGAGQWSRPPMTSAGGKAPGA